MKKINVLQVVAGLGIGGIQKTVQLYTEYLNKDIFNVLVCGLFQGGERGELLARKGFEVYVVNGNQSELIKLMRSKKIDILHIHPHANFNPLPVKAALEAKVPVMVETNIYAEIPDNFFNRHIDMHLMISKWCALRCKKWGRVSWHDFLKKASVLYNPVDLAEVDHSQVLTGSKQDLRKKYRIPKGYLVIGRHGRPQPDKWADLGIEMLPHLLRIISNIKYLVMGFPPAKMAKIRNLGLEDYFIFLEPTVDPEKINELLYLTDVFPTCTVHGESFGNVIAEAMAWRTPVISNSLPHRYNSQVELIDHGKTGLIANTPKDFGEAVAYLLTHPEIRYAMGEAARKKVEGNYEVQLNTKSLEKIYIKLLKDKSVPIDTAIQKRYTDIPCHPSQEEIIGFENEYRNKIRTCWGKPNYMEIYFWEMLLSNYRYYNGLRFFRDKILRHNFN
jgi:glycosyltransferase involved in cell wall biosynthesis